MKTIKTKLGPKTWSAIAILGLFGQLAWVLENMYLNIFMDRTMSRDPAGIAWMVGASAVTATIATLIMGTFSDRRGTRKRLIAVGYIIWGFTVILFGFISVENVVKLFHTKEANAIKISIALVVVLDCIMTALGSTSNDAAFVSWVTDISDKTNRNTIDGILAIMPLIATGLILGAFDPMTQNTYLVNGIETTKWSEGAVLIKHGNWMLFFGIIGGLVALGGVLGLFLIKDSPNLKPNKKLSYMEILYGFKWSVIKNNKMLYFVFIVMCIIGIANNAYMPFMVIYIERTLGIESYVIPIIIIGITAAAGSILFGILCDKFGKSNFIFPVLAIYVVGAVLLTIVSPITIKKDKFPMVAIIGPAFLLMLANLVVALIVNAAARDLMPKGKVGLFTGVKMIFMVLIPMVIGPALTAILTKNSPIAGYDEYGEKIYKYPPYMFLLAGCIALLAVPFLISMYKYFHKVEKGALSLPSQCSDNLTETELISNDQITVNLTDEETSAQTACDENTVGTAEENQSDGTGEN